MVSTAEETLVREQLEDLHARHASRGDDEVVSFYPPEAVDQRHVFGLAGTNRPGTAPTPA